MPYNFESSGLVDHGPFDLSGTGEDKISETLEEMESVYKKFHDALTLAVAKAVRDSIHDLVKNLKEDINQLRKKVSVLIRWRA